MKKEIDIEKLVQTLTEHYTQSTPTFSIDVFQENIEKAKGCKLRPQSPYVDSRCTDLQRMGTPNANVVRTKKIQKYCDEFLRKMTSLYPEYAQEFEEKLSGVQIKMGIHRTTFAEIRRAIKERFEEARRKNSGESVDFEFEDWIVVQPKEPLKEYKYDAGLSLGTAKNMLMDGAVGLSFSQENMIQVLGGSDRHTLYHELIHQMTSKVDSSGTRRVGFQSDYIQYNQHTGKNEYESFGRALNEGMTEKIEREEFKSRSSEEFSAYYQFQLVCDILELCIGKDKLIEAYFNCDIFKIFDALKADDKSKEEFIGFIRSLDFLYDNYEDSALLERGIKEKLKNGKAAIEEKYKGTENNKYKQQLKQKELEELEILVNSSLEDRRANKRMVFKEIGDYLTRLFTQTLVKEIEIAREQGYSEDELRNLAQSQQQRVAIFYEKINKKIGKYKFSSEDTMTILREGIKSATQSKSR